ncbi:MAG: cyclophilin-like fold protein [Clostridia bacterium]|nr:cyclophilin-like fold protein [Clostridia bacterium]
MKNFLSILLSFTLIVLSVSGCSAQAPTQITIIMQIGNPQMTVNGIQTEIDPGRGTTPIIQNERALVPIRAVIEAMGGSVVWDEAAQTAELAVGENNIRLIIGSNTAYLNDMPHTLDTAPTVANGRTILPIRFVAEGFGFQVNWDDTSQTITIVRNLVQEGVSSGFSEENNDMMLAVTLTVNSQSFSARLYDNETTQEWIKQFPVTYDMAELNGNEKYCYISNRLPVNSEHVGNISNGDIMLYGSNCIVVFFQTFSSGYSYTRLGYVEDSQGFANALSFGDVRITFALR